MDAFPLRNEVATPARLDPLRSSLPQISAKRKQLDRPAVHQAWYDQHAFRVALRRHTMEPRPSVFKRSWTMLWATPAAYAVVALLPYVATLGLTILIGRVVVHIHPPAIEHWDPLTLWKSMSWVTQLLITLAMIASATVPTYLAARGIGRLALAQ